MSIIEFEALAKTFKTRERAAGLSGSLQSFLVPRYRQREAVKPISFSLEPGRIACLYRTKRSRKIDYDQNADGHPASNIWEGQCIGANTLEAAAQAVISYSQCLWSEIAALVSSPNNLRDTRPNASVTIFGWTDRTVERGICSL